VIILLLVQDNECPYPGTCGTSFPVETRTVSWSEIELCVYWKRTSVSIVQQCLRVGHQVLPWIASALPVIINRETREESSPQKTKFIRQGTSFFVSKFALFDFAGKVPIELEPDSSISVSSPFFVARNAYRCFEIIASISSRSEQKWTKGFG
jgi:hypothetical protein